MIIDAFKSYRPDAQEGLWALSQLQRIDPSMAIVHHFLKEASRGNDLLQTIEQYEQRWRNVPARIAAEVARLLPREDLRLLLHSQSGQVVQVMHELTRKGFNLRCVQTVSTPGEEGRVQAEVLQQAGLDVQVIEDGLISEIAGDIDACLLGVDQYDHRAFVNKVGSSRLVELMRVRKLPVLVVGDTRKQVDRCVASDVLFEVIAYTANVTVVTEQGPVKRAADENG